MAKEIDQKKLDKLVGIVKANPGNSEKFYAEKSGIAGSEILRYLVQAELKADPKLKMPATGAAIAKARENGVRWPRIAARTGLSEAAAKKAYEEHTGSSARDSYTGRGRNFAGTAASGTATSGRRGSSKKTTAASTKRSTSGRRGATKKTTATPKRGAGRRGTRAGARTADPK